MKNLILCLIAFQCITLSADDAMQNSQLDKTGAVATIDQQLQDLRNERAQCQMSANLASDTADRLMDHNDWTGYRQAVNQQTQMQNRVKEIDAQITALEQKKQKTLL